MKNTLTEYTIGRSVPITDPDTNKKKYVKTLLHPLLKPKYASYFTEEIELISKLMHPCLVKPTISDFDREHGYTFTTDEVPFCSLQDLLDGEKPEFFTPVNKVVIICSIAHTLQYLHMNGIIHGNLKPTNILIDSNYLTRIVDFDLNHFAEESPDQINAHYGKASIYTAPEIIQGGFYDNTIDHYAFGTIIYQILTKSKPFINENPYKLALYIGAGYSTPIPNTIPSPIADVIKGLWNINPGKRSKLDDVIKVFLDNLNYFQTDPKVIGNILNYFHGAQRSALPPNLPKFFHFMKFSSLGGNPAALYDYACVFLDGKGIKPNIEKGLYFLRRSADLGHFPACERLAEILEEGKFAPQDLAFAFDLYSTAAQNPKGDGAARYKQAIFLRDGRGCVPDPELARTAFTEAADLNYPPALNQAGEAYRMSDPGKSRDYFKRAAMANDPLGKFNLALMMEGDKRPQWKEIERLYRESASTRLPQAMNRLGELLMEGRGLKRNPQEASQLFLDASALAYPPALFNFGVCLYNGNGVAQEVGVAKDYIKKAADFGFQPAINFYEQIQ